MWQLCVVNIVQCAGTKTAERAAQRGVEHRPSQSLWRSESRTVGTYIVMWLPVLTESCKAANHFCGHPKVTDKNSLKGFKQLEQNALEQCIVLCCDVLCCDVLCMHLDNINDAVHLLSGPLNFQLFRHVAQSCQLACCFALPRFCLCAL